METVPLNPLRLLTVTDVEPEAPTLKLLLEADNEKPGVTVPTTWTAMVPVLLVIALFVPPVPLIFTAKSVVGPTLELRVHVEVAVSEGDTICTEDGLHETLTPVEAEVELPVAPILTAPWNWNVEAPRPVKVTRTPLLPPLLNETLVVFETILKPLTKILSVVAVTVGKPVGDIESR